MKSLPRDIGIQINNRNDWDTWDTSSLRRLQLCVFITGPIYSRARARANVLTSSEVSQVSQLYLDRNEWGR